jgi:hypothetical protein
VAHPISIDAIHGTKRALSTSIPNEICNETKPVNYRNALNILGALVHSKSIDPCVHHALQDRILSTLPGQSDLDPADLEKMVIGLSRLETSVARSSLMAIITRLSEYPNLSAVIQTMSPHSLANILNCLSKSPDRSSATFGRISSYIAHHLVSRLTSDIDGFDHRLVSLLVRSIVVSDLKIDRSMLLSQVEIWAKSSQGSSALWTPQSYGIFAYYMSQLKCSAQISPSIVAILNQPLSHGLENFTAQNLCNFAVGYCRVLRTLPEILESEIRCRGLSPNDLYFLLKTPLLIQTSLSCFEEAESVGWKDALVITDLLTKHCGGQDFLLTKYGPQLTRIIDSIVSKVGIEDGFKHGRLLFIMGRINYIPPRFCAPRNTYEFDAKTSSAILSTVSKLGISERIGERFLSQRVCEVMSRGTVTDCSLSILSLCSMALFGHACTLVNRMMKEWNYNTLNMMDRSQISKSIVILQMAGESRIVECVLDWIGSTNWDESTRPRPSNTSRTHKEVMRALENSRRKFRIDSEVFVPTIRSFIDIQLIEDN